MLSVWCMLPCALCAAPGKLQTLSALLSGIIAEGSKVVVVSTSTAALDLIDDLLCAPHRYAPADYGVWFVATPDCWLSSCKHQACLWSVTDGPACLEVGTCCSHLLLGWSSVNDNLICVGPCRDLLLQLAQCAD